MEKEMIALLKFKSGDGIFEKFMGWMQSEVALSPANTTSEEKGRIVAAKKAIEKRVK